MIHLRLPLFAVICCIASTCANDDVPGQVPEKISQFIAQYYPSYTYENYTKSKDTYTVNLKSGPCLVFNSKMDWIEVNGLGETLTQYFLFDQMPPAVYEYLQETENLSNVYAVTRDVFEYNVSLFDSVLTYQISSSIIKISYG
jgi:hypothetical protein